MAFWIAMLVCCLSRAASANFETGEFIQTAIKSQFAQARTNWKDLLGHHCPRFGEDDVVAIPLHNPGDTSQATDYKIQLSFDGDKFITPWITLLSKTDKHLPHYPKLLVTFTRTGAELRRVEVEMLDMYAEHELSQEFKNEFQDLKSWPKHLVVHYEFKTHNPVDLSRGLYVLYALGLLVTAITAFNSLWGYRSKLLQFIQDVTLEEDAFQASGPVGAKAD